MRTVWYQGRDYKVFNYPNGTPITTLMYPSTDPMPWPALGYHFVKWERKR